jgi:hypothetical protein
VQTTFENSEQAINNSMVNAWHVRRVAQQIWKMGDVGTYTVTKRREHQRANDSQYEATDVGTDSDRKVRRYSEWHMIWYSGGQMK